MADTPPRHLPPKKEVALALLEGDSVFIHLDPRKEGVLVPRNLGKQPQLVLQIGLNLAIRIPDLNIDDDGISCSLSFSRAPFWCRMPWSAIYALVGPDGRGMLWPEDVPPEVAAQMRAGRGTKQPTPRKQRPKLAAVVDEPADEETASPTAEDGAAGEPKGEPPRRPSKRPVSRPALVPMPRSAPAPGPGAARDRPDPRAPIGAHRRPPQPLSSERGHPGGRPPPPTPAAPHAGSPTGPNARPAPRPDAARHGDDAVKKPRRELPPYLRVVK